jgi:hypothetical protein
MVTPTNPATQLCDDWTAVFDSTINSGAQLAPPAAAVTMSCADPTRRNTIYLDFRASTAPPNNKISLDSFKRFTMTKACPVPDSECRAPLVGDIPKSDAPPQEPKLDAGLHPIEQLNDLSVVTLTGDHLDNVSKVMLDKAELRIVQKTAKKLIVSIPKEVTEKPRKTVSLQLLSDGNDPLLATVTVNP